MAEEAYGRITEKLLEEMDRKIESIAYIDPGTEEYTNAVKNLEALRKLVFAEDEMELRQADILTKQTEVEIEEMKLQVEKEKIDIDLKKKLRELEIEQEKLRVEERKLETPKDVPSLLDKHGDALIFGAFGLAQVVFIVWAEKHDLSVISTKAFPFVGRIFESGKLLRK